MTEESNPPSPTLARDPAANLHRFFGEVGRNWGWVMALGILFIILGTVGIGMSTALTVTTVFVFGILLLVGGAGQVFDAFKCKGWKSVLFHVLIGLLYLGAGITLLNRPLAGSLLLTIVLGGTILAAGISRMIMGFQAKGTAGSGWAIFSGFISLALGLMILIKWPSSGLWVIGLFVAIEMLSHGWACVMIALAARSSLKANA